MSAAKSRKWQSIDVETILSRPFLHEDAEELQDDRLTEKEMDEPIFDDFGLEPSKSVPRPTFETKRCPGYPGAHVVLQAGPGQRSSQLASETRPSRKRKARAENSTPSGVDEIALPKIAKMSTPRPPPQQPWHTACEAPSCPITYPHNFGLSPFEPPSQLLPTHNLVATAAEAGKPNKPGQKRKPEKQDSAGKKRKLDEETVADEHFEEDKAVDFLDIADEEHFLGRRPYMPSEIDSAEARRVKRTGFTPEDKKLLQAFYTAHGGKQQYYGFLGSEIKYQKHREGQRRPPKPSKGGEDTSSKTAKGKRENSKSEHRILPHG